MIFQFEENKAHEYMKTALDYVEVDKKLHTMSMMSGLIRPSGKSIRDRFLKGKVGDNGHPEIDKAFPNTSGFCVYQEDIIKFLSLFCGYDYAKADNIRKKIAKKMSDEMFKPIIGEIDRDFRNYFQTKYEATQEQMDNVIKSFLQIVSDAQRYGLV